MNKQFLSSSRSKILPNTSKQISLLPGFDGAYENSIMVNDVHSQLNSTYISKRVRPRKHSDIAPWILLAKEEGQSICVSGGRHAMGGQQFLSSGWLLDMSEMNKILDFDIDAGLVEVEAGCFWSDLIVALSELQRGHKVPWTIAQKQTGGDRLSIGGALSANAHGRGLTMSPIVSDIEQFVMVTSDGKTLRCSRDENSDLFCLAIGGYGLFGIISSVTLRLVQKCTLRRAVEMCHSSDVIQKLERSAIEGATYGDFQFQIDDKSPDFLRYGILSTYAPVEHPKSHSTNDKKLLATSDWLVLLALAHTQKSAAFEKYSKHYLSTNGQLYSSDTFQLATYIDDYHKILDQKSCQRTQGSELITELYVPRNCLNSFLADAASHLRQCKASVIYGTIRLINRENDTFLWWASCDWVCIVLNIHVTHNSQELLKAKNTFRGLIDLAIKYMGSYYLTYHRFATRQQILACYPQMPLFLQWKEFFDPAFVFRSNWFEYCMNLFDGTEKSS